MKRFLILFFFFLLFASYGQITTDKTFENFSARQDSLFMNAYDQRDVKAYDKLLKEFLSKYNKLIEADKKTYSSYLINAYYNLCCTYSLLNDKVMAIIYLDKSIKAGYFDYGHMKQDKDLDNIRNEKEYIALVEPLRGIGDYLFILRKASKYDTADNRPLPEFTYQSAENPNLVALRKAFNLDSVAGEGNEISKIISLLHWIHNLIPHEGNHENPIVKNAMSMIAECKRDNRGLNCRGLATVLNECYLSMGFKSRIVTCLPKDSLKMDPDCHVINMVFSNSLHKWIWIDPTNDAYVMNDKGELLSIEEVRERIINDQPVILNPDANWNRKFSPEKEYYLYNYMAKNLYILECPVSSEYNMETKESGKVVSYIQLLPLDYFNQKPDKLDEKNEKTNTTLITYKTNNPKFFWQAP
jgi:hypothetical protein